MASTEQVEYVFKSLTVANPEVIFKRIKTASSGIGAAIHILYEANCSVSAGYLSKAMGISTARTAVLLQKLLNKGLIVKEKDGTDARKTLIGLTERGKQTAKAMQKRLYGYISDVIDTVGMEKINTFIALSTEIKDVLIDKYEK